jgi:hypothetical protein
MRNTASISHFSQVWYVGPRHPNVGSVVNPDITLRVDYMLADR